MTRGGLPRGARPRRPAGAGFRVTGPTARPPAAAVDPATLVLMGVAAGAFGVRGEIKVRSFTADPGALFGYGPLYDSAGRTVLTPKGRPRAIKDGFAVMAHEVPDREAAMALRNVGLHVPRAVLPPPDDDEVYHIDLIGCAAVSPDGAGLGVVVAVPNFGAGDLLEIRPPSGPTFYVPFTRAAVPEVDVADKRLVVILQDGDTGAPVT